MLEQKNPEVSQHLWARLLAMLELVTNMANVEGHIDLVLKELIAKLLADLYLPQKKVKSPPFL